MNYVVFNDDGNIIRTGQCPDDDLQYQGPVGYVLNGFGHPTTHYVANHELVEYTPEQRAAKTVQPTFFHLWSNETMSWVDTRPLDVAKSDKWVQVKSERMTRCEEPLVVDGRTYDATPYSQSQISGAVTLAMLAPADWSIDWTLADNTVVALSKAEVIALGVALGQRTQEVFTQARTLRIAIDGSQTVAEVEGITWD